MLMRAQRQVAVAVAAAGFENTAQAEKEANKDLKRKEGETLLFFPAFSCAIPAH